ncbi:MAG: hypothetical protein AAF684_01250, partial [Pseudomonadota bacterium]
MVLQPFSIALLSSTALRAPSRVRPLALAMSMTLAAGVASADPELRNIEAGRADVSRDGAVTTFTNKSGRVVANWNDLDVPEGHTLAFTGGTLTINRDLSGTRTNWDGTVTSDHTFVVHNRHGLTVGDQATIDINGKIGAGLVVSTQDISTENAMAGRLVFDGEGPADGATIVNRGTISIAEGGFAALVAPEVANAGVILAPVGKVELASGDAFTVDPVGDGLITFLADQGEDRGQIGPRVTNTGEISAEGGYIALTAQSIGRMVENAVALGGVTRAGGLARGENGEIRLTAIDGGAMISGTVEAPTLTVEAAKVDIAQATITARSIDARRRRDI